MPEWRELQLDALRALGGRTIVRWLGVEMAVREHGADGQPQWYDEAVPALQLGRLDLVLNGGEVASIVTCQNGDQWGLCRADEHWALPAIGQPPEAVRASAEPSIYRVRALVELPVGRVKSVRIQVDDRGDVAGLQLDIDGRIVELWAAEVYEECDGTVRIGKMDESILVQVDGCAPALQRGA